VKQELFQNLLSCNFRDRNIRGMLLSSKRSAFIFRKVPEKCTIVYSSKGIVRPFELSGETRLIRSSVINYRPGKFFFNFNDTVSREEHKTIKLSSAA
jgi:hypothetical protein